MKSKDLTMREKNEELPYKVVRHEVRENTVGTEAVLNIMGKSVHARNANVQIVIQDVGHSGVVVRRSSMAKAAHHLTREAIQIQHSAALSPTALGG